MTKRKRKKPQKVPSNLTFVPVPIIPYDPYTPPHLYPYHLTPLLFPNPPLLPRRYPPQSAYQSLVLLLFDENPIGSNFELDTDTDADSELELEARVKGTDITVELQWSMAIGDSIFCAFLARSA